GLHLSEADRLPRGGAPDLLTRIVVPAVSQLEAVLRQGELGCEFDRALACGRVRVRRGAGRVLLVERDVLYRSEIVEGKRGERVGREPQAGQRLSVTALRKLEEAQPRLLLVPVRVKDAGLERVGDVVGAVDFEVDGVVKPLDGDGR